MGWSKVWQSSFGSLLRILPRAEIVLLLFLSSLAVNDMLANLEIMPDSTNYITAAGNFVETGKFFVYANWPSRTYEPGVEPYTEYPPGFPLFLAPFRLFFRDPILAAVVGQGACIVALFALLYLIVKSMEFGFPLRLAAYLFVSSFISYRIVLRILLSDTLFVCTSLAVIACSMALTGERRDRRDLYWFLLYFSLFCSSSVKFVGVMNLAYTVVPIFLCRHKRWAKAGLAGLSAVAPVLLWMVRNLVVTGVFTRSHLSQWSAHDTLFLTALGRIRIFWGMGSLVLSWLLLVLMVAPVAIGIWKRDRPWLRHCVITSGALATLLGMMVLSKIVYFEFLDHRLLLPSYTAMGIALLSSFHLLSRWNRYASVLHLVPFVYFAVNPYFHNELAWKPHWTFAHPKEEALWEELNRIQETATASYFITDYDFLHQIYSRRPQRIVWHSEDVKRPEDIQKFLDRGGSVFFLFQKEHMMKDENGLTIRDHFLQNSQGFPFKRIELGNFEAYFLER